MCVCVRERESCGLESWMDGWMAQAQVVSVADEVPPNEIKGLMDELASREDLGKRGEGWFIVQAVRERERSREIDRLLYCFSLFLLRYGACVDAHSCAPLLRPLLETCSSPDRHARHSCCPPRSGDSAS